VVVVGIVLSVIAIAACAKPPQQAIDQANAAVSSAAQAEAATYAADEWAAAQQSMNNAMAEIEAQQAKFAPLRSYKSADELLTKAQQDAAAAQAAAVEAKAAARAEVEQAIAGIEASFAQADQALQALETCRRRPKGFASDLEIMRGNVDGLRAQLADVQAAAADEQFLEAKTLASELQQQVGTVVTDLENAKTKLGC
jgi:chromosome segregation ATPase